MLGSRTDLHIFDAVSVNGTRYCNEILLPYVRFFRGATSLQFLFMDDNAPRHSTVAADQLLESERRRLAARTLPPVTIRELRLALQDEWAAIPQQQQSSTQQGCFGLQSQCAQCNFFNKAFFYPSDFFFNNMLTKYQMIKFIDLCEVWFLLESVARVAAIVGDHRCLTPPHWFKETLNVFLCGTADPATSTRCQS
ncbi:transposable element Tcb2 transposase [Trichonephila clavipes]|nr:transposable element Tcb2 transposase [Trichonephila clavipes]